MEHQQTQTEWESRMADRALGLARSELYLRLRYLDTALGALPPQPDPAVSGLGTEGASLRFDPDWVLTQFKINDKYLPRIYLHTVLHCLFRHLWTRGARNPQLWDIACDIAVESVIDSLPDFKRPMTLLRTRTYEAIRETSRFLAAGTIYRWLAAQKLYPLERLQREFWCDDHRYWAGDRSQQPESQLLSKRWETISRGTQTQMESRANEQSEGESPMAEQLSAARSRRSYRQFLRKFAALREEPHLDPDTFDLNYYTYGLSLYGNMPLVEPLETTEQLRVEEFVIVLDTSYSTSGELIMEFLRQTFAILKSSQSFSRRCNLRVLQCDDTVKVDTRVNDLEQLDRLLAEFTVIGGGGTDFRPAFAYVEILRQQKAFRRLRGLLYLTDGKGIYPSHRPDYDTAFLFLDQHYDDSGVPPWAMRLVLEPEEILPSTPPELPHLEPDYDPMQEDIQL